MPLSHTFKSFENWFFRWSLQKKVSLPPNSLSTDALQHSKEMKSIWPLALAWETLGFTETWDYVLSGYPQFKKHIKQGRFQYFKKSFPIPHLTLIKIKISFEEGEKFDQPLKRFGAQKLKSHGKYLSTNHYVDNPFGLTTFFSSSGPYQHWLPVRLRLPTPSPSLLF